MQHSFLILESKNSKALVEQLHANIWYVRDNKIVVEVGLLVKATDGNIESALNPIRLQTPFAIKEGTAISEFHKFTKRQNVQLIFNDFIQSFDWKDRDKTIKVSLETKTKVFLITEVTLSISGINSINIIPDTPINSEIKGIDSVYYRLLFEVDIKKSSNILINRGSFGQQILYDLRFNERRLLGNMNHADYDSMLGIDNIYIFVIQPSRHRILINGSSILRYVRFLERQSRNHRLAFRRGIPSGGWDDFIGGLQNSPYLVYSWKAERSGNDNKKAFRLLISFEIKSILQSRLILSLFLALFTSFFLSIMQIYDIRSIANGATTIFPTYINTISLYLGAILVGVLSNILWDIVKRFSYRIMNRP